MIWLKRNMLMKTVFIWKFHFIDLETVNEQTEPTPIWSMQKVELVLVIILERRNKEYY